MNDKIIASLWSIAKKMDKMQYITSIDTTEHGVVITDRNDNKQVINFPKSKKGISKKDVQDITDTFIKTNINDLRDEFSDTINAIPQIDESNISDKIQRHAQEKIDTKLDDLKQHLEKLVITSIPQPQEGVKGKDGKDADEEKITKNVQSKLDVIIQESSDFIANELHSKLEKQFQIIKNSIPAAVNGKDGRDADEASITKNIEAKLDAEISDLKAKLHNDFILSLKALKSEIPEVINGKDGKDGKDADEEKIISYCINSIEPKLKTEIAKIKPIDGINGSDGKDGFDGKDADEEKILQYCLKILEDKIKTEVIKLQNSLSEYINSLVAKIKSISGSDGKNGKDGRDGRDGKDGKDGKQGPKGELGAEGKQGKRGNGVQDARIEQDHLIIETDDKLIDAGKVSIQQFYGGGNGGGGGTTSYTNTMPMPFTVGGLSEGTKFKNISMNSLITKLLYGYDLPYFDVFAITGLNNDVEVGYALPAGEYEFVFNVTNTELFTDNSIEINKDQVAIASNLPNESPITLTLEEEAHQIPHATKFEILGFDTTGSSFNKYYPLSWKHKIYYGEYTEDIDDNDLPNPLSVLRASELVDNIYGEYLFQDIAYKWFCYPEELGDNYVFYDLVSDIAMVFDEVRKIDVVNDYGLTITYNCYRTLNEINNEFIMVAKNG